MRFVNPDTDRLTRSRDALLQKSLRDQNAPFAIGSEYPLVLARDAAQFSYCLEDQGRVVAHANLWPRELRTDGLSAGARIGLVGNVATDAALRGQGLMRAVMDELKERAAADGLEALLLWSDLLEFYQKLGFQSVGREDRFSFRRQRLPRASGWHRITEAPASLTENRLAKLLESRLAVPRTLARSAAEFRALCAIPGLEFFVPDAGPGYAIMGKGMDMINVVHEWGAPDPESMLHALAVAADSRGFSEVMLLAPKTLAAPWREAFARIAERVETHAMALAWLNGNSPKTLERLEQSFVWGLDSI